MSIHHNTIKRAATLGLTLTSDHTGRVTVSGEIFPGAESDWIFPNPDGISISTYAKNTLQAVYQARVYAKEYGLEIKQSATGVYTITIPGGQHLRGSDLDDVMSRAVDKAIARQEAEELVQLRAVKPKAEKPAASAKPKAKKAAIKPVVTEEDEDAADLEDAEEEDQGPSGSVVREKYRDIYRERGNPNNCGDDMAAQLEIVLKSGDALDVDRLIALATLNGIDSEKYMTGTRGYLGRARMSIGNILRGRVRRGQEVVLEVK